MRYFIISDDLSQQEYGRGFRLCKDDRWREFANFGTYLETVKIYKLKGAAITKAAAIGGKVVGWPEGLIIEAGGDCFFEITTAPGFHKIEHHDLSEFVVWEK